MKKLLIFLLLVISIYAETGLQLTNPSSAVYDFTFTDMKTSNVQTFKSESVVEKALVEVAKMTKLTRRTPNIYSCGFDGYGNKYCPASLAEAAEYWDYEDGFANESLGEVVDYTAKNTTCTSTQPIISGSWNDQWWNCDSCGTMPISRLQTLIQKAGGSGPIVTSARKNGVLNNSDRTVQIGINSTYININPNEIAVVTYKKIRNGSTGETASSGGKPTIYLKGSTTCQNWQIKTATKDYPTHYYCADTGSNDIASCPLNYAIGINDLGYKYCYSCSSSCPADYAATSGAEVTNGECRKKVNYPYYTYYCTNSVNIQGNNFVATSFGGNTGKSDPNNTTDNTAILSTVLNSSTPPSGNCKRQGFKCNQNIIKPAFVDGRWKCSPYLCEEQNRCGYATCPSGTTPSAAQYQDIAYNVLGADYSGVCNGPICDYVANTQISFCTSGTCPNGAEYETSNGKCYKKECPAGTYNLNGTCVRQN